MRAWSSASASSRSCDGWSRSTSRPASRSDRRRSSERPGGLEVSSSTVRSELYELEAIGLLMHPHTSAGRVPTQSGYRVYTEELVGGIDGRPGAVSTRSHRDAERARGGAAADDRGALGDDASPRARLGAGARGGGGAARRGAAAPVARRDRRRDHGVGRGVRSVSSSSRTGSTRASSTGRARTSPRRSSASARA